MLFQNLTAHPGPGYYGTVTTEVQVTSATIPTTPSAFCWPQDGQQTNKANRPPSKATTLQLNNFDEMPTRLAAPIHPNAPGGLSPIQAHNYPWSREPSTFNNASGDIAVLSPAATLVNSSDAGSRYAYPHASSHERGQPGHSFENTGFNGATQFTSISAGSSNADDHDRPVAPTATTTTNESREQDGRTKQAKKKRRSPKAFRRLAKATHKFGAKLRNMDPVKLAYLRTSFVFAISVLVTWTPSSINRVYTLIYPERVSWGLNIAAAVVLPLQGVWNAVIYFTTSWKIFREEMETTRAGLRVLEFLRLDTGATMARHNQSFAMSSSLMTPRSEMGRNRRLEGDYDHEIEVDMVGPTRPQRPRPVQRASTIRVMKKGLEDFA